MKSRSNAEGLVRQRCVVVLFSLLVVGNGLELRCGDGSRLGF
jgi:hypothetical protein